MKYRSTRGSAPLAGAAEAIVRGIAPDGGLYVPCKIPSLRAQEVYGLSYAQTAAKVLGLFLEEYAPEFLLGAAQEVYGTGFAGRAGYVRPVEEGLYALELWHGPTCAFKDYALQLMPRLLVEAKRILGDTRTTEILVATSGDTGKAALAGFAGLPGIKIAVFYPSHGTSEVQRLQMVTQEGENVAVYAIRGNFDDAQTGVKRAFASEELRGWLAAHQTALSSANSINWGRLVPQIVYYFYCYAQLVQAGKVPDGTAVDFCVPTGNFGDILAGWYAKQMGLPVGRLVCASNRNDVLTQFLSTGVYDAKRPFYKTSSPSMDILVSSNLERLLYHVTQDSGKVSGWMQALAQAGRYEVPQAVLCRIRQDFACTSADDTAAAQTLGDVWHRTGYLMDPHTAVAYGAACRNMRGGVPCVVLSTASPYKFPSAVLTALGRAVPEDEFEAMHMLASVTGLAVPQSLACLRDKPVRFDCVIEKDGVAQAARLL